MKLYAIVIGRKGRHSRHVTISPFCENTACASDMCLAVFTDYQKAQTARRLVLKELGHKSVYIIIFLPQTRGW